MPRAKIDRLEKNIEPAPSCRVQMKRMGNITEVRYMRKSGDCNIRKLNAENYMIISTGEVKEFQHADSRADNKTSVAQSLARLRDLLNTNITDPTKALWVTLTYRENMRDGRRLYEDFRRFWQRFKSYLNKSNNSKCEYFAVAEPQQRGAFHLHVIFVFKYKAPFIPNDTLAKIWGHGFTKTKALKDVDNVGLYLTAYLTDMELSESFQYGNIKGDLKAVTTKDEHGNKRQRAIVKGARISLYPPGFRMYRTSRGIKKPEIVNCTEAEAMEEVGTAPLVFERTIRISNNEEYAFNIINYRQYNKARKENLSNAQKEPSGNPN